MSTWASTGSADSQRSPRFFFFFFFFLRGLPADPSARRAGRRSLMPPETRSPARGTCPSLDRRDPVRRATARRHARRARARTQAGAERRSVDCVAITPARGDIAIIVPLQPTLDRRRKSSSKDLRAKPRQPVDLPGAASSRRVIASSASPPGRTAMVSPAHLPIGTKRWLWRPESSHPSRLANRWIQA